MGPNAGSKDVERSFVTDLVKAELYSLSSLFSSSITVVIYLFIYLFIWSFTPKQANAQAGAVSAASVPLHPWGLVPSAPGTALFGLRDHCCGTSAWPRCDFSENKMCCCIFPGDSMHMNSPLQHTEQHHAFLLESQT